MAKWSTGLRNSVLDTGSLKAALADGYIHIYEGTMPSSADDQIDTSGSINLLATIYSDGGTADAGLEFGASASAGSLSKAGGETWDNSDAGNIASGTAAFFVHVGSSEADGDTIAASTTAPRILGSVATIGADMNLSSTSLTSGQTLGIDNYAVALPEEC